MTTTTNKKRCPTCHQVIKKLNPHHVCRNKVALLELLHKLWVQGHKWVRVEEGYAVKAGEKIYKTAYCARQLADRLVWFGLLNHRGRRTGEYQINSSGVSFMLGKTSVPKTIWCQEGEVLEESVEKVFVQNVRKVVLDKAYWDSYASRQKYR